MEPELRLKRDKYEIVIRENANQTWSIIRNSGDEKIDLITDNYKEAFDLFNRLDTPDNKVANRVFKEVAM